LALVFSSCSAVRLEPTLLTALGEGNDNVPAEAALAEEDPQIHAMVVNGKKDNSCKYKWLVGLTTRAGKRPYCGGSLIAKDWVLTAAHCTFSYFEVVAGEHMKGRGQMRMIVQKTVHPRYDNTTYAWDLALVKLKEPFESTGCAGTIRLPREHAGKKKCMIGGWGTIDRHSGEKATELHTGTVWTMKNWGCVWWTRYWSSEIKDSMLCARGSFWSGVDTCQGDSGGPLMCQDESGDWILDAVTSWGRGCGSWTLPGVYARVFEARDWIDKTIGVS